MMSEEANNDQAITQEATEAQEPKLYANKFDTIEKLENGYKESLGVHIKNKELEEKLSQLTAVPEKYTLPDNIKLDEISSTELASVAKNIGLTQKQFETAAQKRYSDNLDAENQFNERKASVGEDKINLINTYIKDNFSSVSESIRADLFTKLISDDSSLQNVLKDRDARLSSSVPGMGDSAPNQKVDLDVLIREAAMENSRSPNNLSKRARYIELCNQKAERSKQN